MHLADWPVVDADALDDALEAEMERARAVVSLGLSARNEAKLKVRQPLRRALVLLPDGGAFSDEVAAEVADALNVKELEAVTDLEGLLDYAVVPNFRALGPTVAQPDAAGEGRAAAADGGTVKRALDADGHYDLVLADGTTVQLGPDDVEVRAESHAELALAQEGGYAVAIDTTVDDELRAEGIARDLIRLLNDQRKAAGLEIADRIRVRLVRHGTRRSGRARSPRLDRPRGARGGVRRVAARRRARRRPRVEVDGDPLAIELVRVER